MVPQIELLNFADGVQPGPGKTVHYNPKNVRSLDFCANFGFMLA